MIVIPHVISIEYLRPEDVKASARVMYDMGHPIDDCPFEKGSDLAVKWREHFIACQLHEEGEPE